MNDLVVTLGAAAPEDDVPVLGAGAEMELPDGATLNPDGSVHLALAHPFTLRYRDAAGAEVKTEECRELTLRRLTGRDMRRVMDAAGSKGTQIALARSAGLTPAKMALLQDKMDAADMMAAKAVVDAMLEMGEDLPERAETQEDGSILLPLRGTVADGDGTAHDTLTFRRLTGADLIAIGGAKDTLPFALHRATGLTLRAAQGLFDEMDGADIVAVNRVVSFLAGSGPKTGR